MQLERPTMSNDTPSRLQSHAICVDWVRTVGDYANVLLYSGILVGDLAQYTDEAMDPTGRSSGVLLRVTNSIRTVCQIIQKCFLVFRYYCWICLKIGISPFITALGIGLVCLAIGAMLIHIPGNTLLVFINGAWAALKQLWTLLSPLLNPLLGIFTIMYAIFIVGEASATSLLMITGKEQRCGHSTDGNALFALDQILLILSAFNTVCRAMVSTALPINKGAEILDPDPDTQKAIQAGCGITIILCGMTPPLVSLAMAGLETTEAALGYAIQ